MRLKVISFHTVIDKLKYFVYSTAVLSNIIFFSINSLLGIEYEGSETGSGYMYFTATIFAVVLFFTLKDFKRAQSKFCYLLPLFFSLIFLFEYSFSSNIAELELMKQSIKSFWAFAAPCILVGANLGNTKELTKIYPWIDFWALFISLGCISAIPRLLLSGNIQFGGGNYQQLSYSSALMCSIFLYNLISKKKYRFDFLNNKLYSFVTILLMLGCIACILSSGGRGGFLLLAINVCWMCLSRIKFLFKKLPVILFFIVLAFFALPLFDISIFDDLFDFRFQRIINTFLTDGGISVSNSGRQEVFGMSIDMIRSNPFGYGFFRSYAIMGVYPHNIFLEILLDGGYLLLFLFIILIVRIAKKVLRIKKSLDIGLFVVLCSYPIVMLMYTSTYLWSGAFWFCVVFVLSYKFSRYFNQDSYHNS